MKAVIWINTALLMILIFFTETQTTVIGQTNPSLNLLSSAEQTVSSFSQ